MITKKVEFYRIKISLSESLLLIGVDLAIFGMTIVKFLYKTL